MATFAMPHQLMPLDSRPRTRGARLARRAPFSAAGAARIGCMLAGLAACAYALGVCFVSAVPRLPALPGTAAGIAIDVALLAALVLHFHYIERPGAPRAAGSPAALAKSSLLVALVFGLWQPLPVPVWTITAGTAVAAVWFGYAAGWALLLLRATRPAGLVVGVALVEWCSPTLSLGHLVFAAGLTGFVVMYRESLARYFRMPAQGRRLR